MNAFFFKPTNEFLGKFKVESASEVPVKFVEFYSCRPTAPPFSYIEADGLTWTVVSLDPLQLEQGRVSKEMYDKRKQFDAETQAKGPAAHNIRASSVHEVLRQVIVNQERQLAMLRSIRWIIAGFGLWFIIQIWLLPKLLIPK